LQKIAARHGQHASDLLRAALEKSENNTPMLGERALRAVDVAPKPAGRSDANIAIEDLRRRAR
jgi:hypothetical protein